MVPRTGPRSTSSALKTSSLYQAEKSSLCGVTPRSSRATCRGYGIGPAGTPPFPAASCRLAPPDANPSSRRTGGAGGDQRTQGGDSLEPSGSTASSPTLVVTQAEAGSSPGLSI